MCLLSAFPRPPHLFSRVCTWHNAIDCVRSRGVQMRLVTYEGGHEDHLRRHGKIHRCLGGSHTTRNLPCAPISAASHSFPIWDELWVYIVWLVTAGMSLLRDIGTGDGHSTDWWAYAVYRSGQEGIQHSRCVKEPRRGPSRCQHPSRAREPPYSLKGGSLWTYSQVTSDPNPLSALKMTDF